MTTQPHSSVAKRRDFLKLAMTAGGALAASSIADKTLAEAEPKVTAEVSSTFKQGYRETAHVRAYYDKARL